jgi:proteasome lid subunit RPN8/RPN11
VGAERDPQDPLAGSASAARLVIPAALCERILDHARHEQPRECCGLLVGAAADGGAPAVVRDIVPARNVLGSRIRYRIDPRDHFAAIRLARSLGRAVIGGYHSHPASPPVPSPTDRAEAWPGFVYLIAATGPGFRDCPLRAWELLEGNFTELTLVTPE